MYPPRRFFWSVLALALAGVASAQATVFRGPPGLKGDVLVFPAPEALPSLPAELQGIVLLPVDAVGRSTFREFQPDQPRRMTDVPLASRILLPQHQGSLYRYRRDRKNGADFGYFVVHANGLASFVASFPGSGAAGTGDPIPFPVALARTGDAMLIATTPEAGGNLHLIDLQAPSIRSLTAGFPPLEFIPQGLSLLQTWGSALTTTGPMRFSRAGSADFVPLFTPNLSPILARKGARVRVPLVPLHLGDGIVGSSDESTVAVVAGRSPTESHVFTFGATGSAICVNDVPASITGPGFGSDSGPWLALSPDGQRVAWKTVGASGECFTRKVCGMSAMTTLHITGDASFADTLNDTGVISFIDPESVVILVGETNGTGGVEQADLYKVTFDAAGGTTMTNLSNTSGDANVPFLAKGDLETTDGIFQIPGGIGAVYYVPGSSGQGRIFRLDADTGVSETLRTGVDAVSFVERAGENYVYGIILDGGLKRELVKIPFDLSLPARRLALFPSTTDFGNHAGNLTGSFAFAFGTLSAQMLGQIFLPTGAADGMTTMPFAYGPTLGFDGSGAVLASVDVGSRSYPVSWTNGSAPRPYRIGNSPGMVLPGN